MPLDGFDVPVPPADVSVVHLEVVQYTCPNTNRRVGTALLHYKIDGIWINECPSCMAMHVVAEPPDHPRRREY